MNKRRTFSLSAAFFIFCFSASAQTEDEKPFTLPKAVFKISPLHFFNSTFQFGTEIFNNAHSRSLNIDVGVRSSSIEYDNAKGLTTEIGYRKYVRPMVLRQRKTRQFYQGIYYSFYVQGSYFKGDNTYYSYSSSVGGPDKNTVTIMSISPGFYMGLQKTLWEVILMDVYIGGGIRMSDVKHSVPDPYYYDDDLFQPGYEGIYPKIGIKFGIGL